MKSKTYLKVFIYATSFIFACLMVLSVWSSDKIGNPQDHIGLQSISVLFTLISIPLVLKLYKNKVETGDPIDEKTYIQWNVIRLGVVDLAFCLNIATYTLVNTTSPLLCAAIVWIIHTFFCRPAEYKKEEE